MKNKIKELKEKLNNNLDLNILEGKLDIKPIKEETNKLIYFDHEHRKKTLNLVLFCLKEKNKDKTLSLVITNITYLNNLFYRSTEATKNN